MNQSRLDVVSRVVRWRRFITAIGKSSRADACVRARGQRIPSTNFAHYASSLFAIGVLVAASLLVPTFAFAAGREITTPIYGPNGGVGGAVVASNGETFLTAWGEDGQVHGSLADRQGHVITPVSFSILTLDSSVIGAFDLAAMGTNYIVAFTTYQGFQVAELSATGTLLKITKIDAPFRGHEAPRVRVASNGSSILIVAPAGKSSAQTQTVAYLLDREGAILRSTSLGQSQISSNVIVQGDEYVVALNAPSSIVAYRMAADGAVVRSSAIGLDAPSTTDIALAARGNEALVMWTGSRGTPQTALLLRDGRVGSIRTLPVGSLSLRHSVALTSTATGYVAALLLCGAPNSGGCGAYLLRLDDSGRSIDGTPFRVSANVPTSMDALGPVLLLITNSSTVENHAIDPVTMAVSSSTVSISAALQLEPSLASNGVDFFATFLERTVAGAPVKGARFTREGAPLDGSGLQIGSDTGSGFSAVAYGAETYMVVWIDSFSSTLYARRFDPMGNAIDAEPVAVGPAAYLSPPAVAWNGQKFLAVWPQNSTIVGVLLPARGNFAGGAIPLATRERTYEYFADPDVASDGSQFLVTWGVYPFFCDPCAPIAHEVRAAGVDASGVPFEGKPVVVANGSRGRVASSGAGFLIAVDTNLRPIESPSVWGVSTATAHAEGGTLRIDAPRLQFSWPSATRSDVAWDGRDYVIAWRYEAVSTALLGAMRVTRSGFAFDRRSVMTGRPTFSTNNHETTADPAMAANDLGDVAIVTSESSRLRAYFVSEMPGFPQVPGAPENVRASLSGGRLTIAWDPPPGDVLEYTFDLASLWESRSSGGIAAPATTYTFVPYPVVTQARVRVRAWNAAGSSEPSAWVQVPATRSRSIRH